MLSCRDSFLRILHGGSGALTLTMPDTELVQHNGLPSGPEQNLPKQLSQLPLPTRFDGANGPNQAECWIRWSRRFERYRIASGLKIKPEHEHVSTLLYALGDCADDILATLRLDETKATYDEVRTALNGYFDVRRNLIVQQAAPVGWRVSGHIHPRFIQACGRLRVRFAKRWPYSRSNRRRRC